MQQSMPQNHEPPKPSNGQYKFSRQSILGALNSDKGTHK
eukprot:UN21140